MGFCPTLHIYACTHHKPKIYGYGRNAHLWHFQWPKCLWPKCLGRKVLGRNVRGRNVRAPHEHVLKTLIFYPSHPKGITLIPGAHFLFLNCSSVQFLGFDMAHDYALETMRLSFNPTPPPLSTTHVESQRSTFVVDRTVMVQTP